MASGGGGGKRATARWQILRKAVLAASGKTSGECAAVKELLAVSEVQEASVRSFSTFELFEVTDIERPQEVIGPQDTSRELWKRYTYRRTAGSNSHTESNVNSYLVLHAYT